ncbi:MAG: ActS/PrrB/RegB family redox-sensitive histidine kinase [Hyphomicrobiaceae bacterium]|nr:ActS/PrrB/RegB family redox-sensitive histidine kinase [Hyphomicrobiaceae bacterium]
MELRQDDQRLRDIASERESQLRLQTSVRLRWIAILGQLAAVAIVTGFYGFAMPVGICLVLIALSAWLNVYLSIRFPARYRIGTRFATALLAYDTLQLGALLYLTGGIQNPFAPLIVAPVTVSAATQPRRSTILLGAITLATVTFLVTQYYPLPWIEGFRFELPRDYKIGLLAAIASSMIFTAVYVWRISKEARMMSAALTATDMVLASEQRLHALDGLAAAAAHELGTPLSTIVLVSKELERELGPDSRYGEDLTLLRSQAQRCREILQKLTKKPDEQDPMHASVTVREIIDESVEPHKVSTKRIVVSAHPILGAEGDGRLEPVGERKPGVIYGLGNIIENAIDFAASEVEVSARWSAEDVSVTIADDGPGFSPDLMDSIGEPYVSTRRLHEKREKEHSGLGLGFFIAKTLLERSGASVNFSNRPAPQHGAVIVVTWPRKAFERRNIFLRTM